MLSSQAAWFALLNRGLGLLDVWIVVALQFNCRRHHDDRAPFPLLHLLLSLPAAVTARTIVVVVGVSAEFAGPTCACAGDQHHFPPPGLSYALFHSRARPLRRIAALASRVALCPLNHQSARCSGSNNAF